MKAEDLREGSTVRSSEPEATPSHTPGPWKAVKGQTNGESNDAWGCVQQDDGWIIADIQADGEELSECADANAHLIAAAPELLDALRELADIVSGTHGDQYPAYEVARDLLSRFDVDGGSR